jgi:hypothetical protein
VRRERRVPGGARGLTGAPSVVVVVGCGVGDLLQHLLGVIRGEGGGHVGRVGWVVVQGGKGGWDDHRRKKPGSEYLVVADQGLYSSTMRELQGSRWLKEVNSPSPRLRKFFSALSWRIPPSFIGARGLNLSKTL